jgi:hypothetical protein
VNHDTIQPSLFDAPENSSFDGSTFDPERDAIRLTGQLKKVYEVMKDGQWYTLKYVSSAIGYASEAAISARMRDFRKAKFGGHQVERRNLNGGLWQYRLIVRDKE